VLCSDKSVCHGSTSRVRSNKRIEDNEATKEKKSHKAIKNPTGNKTLVQATHNIQIKTKGGQWSIKKI
jgi:hypothetical protein